MSIFDLFKKPTLLDLFLDRYAVNEKATSKIMKAIKGTLDALHEQMNIDKVTEQGGVLHWEDVSLIDDGEQQYVVLVGSIAYPPGAEIELDSGDKIKLTHDTAPYFNRLARATLPAEMAVKSKEEVFAYLKNIEEENARQIQTVMADADFNSDGPSIGEILAGQSKEKEMTFDEFDLTQLTDEQRKSYQMGVKPGKA